MSVDTIITEIEKLNVLELVELTKTLQEKWGVSAAPVAAAAGPVAVAEAAPAAAVVEEQTEFDAILSEVGPNKTTTGFFKALAMCNDTESTHNKTWLK